MICSGGGASLRLYNIMNHKPLLILGDMFAIAIVTFIGFASHGEADVSFLPRMAAAFFPLLLAWFLVSPWLGLFDEAVVFARRQFWRPAFAMIVAAPMAVVLRAALLNTTASPLFTLVLGSTSALGMTIWRGLYGYFAKPK